MSFKRNVIFLWLMAALALTPAALYAYLGQFVRLMGDDYCHAALGQELGAWGGMLDRYNNWSGAYSSYFLSNALAPLDALPSMMMPPLIIVLWLVGLFWLLDEGLTHLKISHSRRPLALTMAALALAAAVNGFPSPRSFYHYSANIRYTLPLALLVIYLAMTFWLAGRWERGRSSYLGLIAGGLLCFVMAGASEMFLVFQLTFLTSCLLVSFAWRRRVYARIFSVGCLATLVGLMIQLNAPGIAIRAAWIEKRFGRPDRSPLAWISRTFDTTLEALGHPQIFAGFVLLLSLGLLAALFTYQPPKTLKTSKPVELVSSALWLGLMLQLLCLPILWSHSSNIPQFLGRFSLRYMVVIVLNLAFISGFGLLLWRRGPINAYLQRHEHSLPLFCNGLLLIFVILFALSQLTSYYLSASWLFVTALMFLGLLCWQLSSLLPGAEPRKIGSLALCSLGMGLVCMAAVVGAAVFGRGFAVLRILASGASLLVFSGLIWGFFLGCLVKHLPSQYGQVWINWLKMASLALALIIGLGIMRGQATLAPDFQRYTQGWHQRHLDIIAQRGNGQKSIKTAPLSYNMTDYADVDTLAADWVNDCARRYYGVDAIAVMDS